MCGGCVERADPKADDELLERVVRRCSTRSGSDLRERMMLDGCTARARPGMLVAFVQWHTESRFRAFTLLPVDFATVSD